MFCSNCGEPLVEGSKFCPKCGAQQLTNQTVAEPQNSFEAQNPVEPQNPFVAQNPVEPQNPFGAQNPVEPQNPFGASQQDMGAQNLFGGQNPIEPQNPFGAPQQDMGAQNPFGGQNPVEPQNPFGAPQQDMGAQNPFEPQNPFGAPQQDMGAQNPFEPQNPFGVPQQGMGAQNPYGSQDQFGTPQQGSNQWGPMMQPEKKSKKPLIIGLIVAFVAIVVAVVVIVLIVFSGSKDKDDNKSTKAPKETTTELKEPTVKDGEYSDSEMEKEAKNLLDKYMKAVVSKSLTDVKKVYLESVYNKMMDDYAYYGYTDDEIFEELQLVPVTFGTIQKYTINDVTCNYCNDVDDDFISYCGAKSEDNLVRYYSIEGTMTVESAERKGTFEYGLYVIQSKDSLTLYNVDGYSSSFDDYDYEFKGTGEDEFGDWYITDDSEDPTGDPTIDDDPIIDDPIDDPSDVDEDEIIQGIIDKADYTGKGVSNIDDLSQKAVKEALARNYDGLKMYMVPEVVAMYEVFSEAGLYDDVEIGDSIFEGINVLASVTMVSSTVSETQDLTDDELQEYNDELQMFGGTKIDTAKTIVSTVKYKDSNNNEKSVQCQIIAAKIADKWYIADMAFDTFVE